MLRRLELVCLVTGALALQGCASAGKDIHFRSRLPTQELPLILRQQGSAFGLDLDVENQRYARRPTNDLLTNFNFAADTRSFSENERGLNGIDASVTYRRRLDSLVVMKIGVSTDFVELQIDPTAVFAGTDTWFVNLNGGFYRTTAYTSTGSGSCGFICFGGTEDAALKESKVSTDQSGSDRKMGLQLTKVWHNRHALTFSAQWMDYYYRASARKETGEEIRFEERAYAAGYGLGYALLLERGNVLSLTADSVQMHTADRTIPETVVGLRFSGYLSE